MIFHVFLYLANLTEVELKYISNLILNFSEKNEKNFIVTKKWIILNNIYFLVQFLKTFENLRLKIIPSFILHKNNVITIKSKFYNTIVSVYTTDSSKTLLLSCIKKKQEVSNLFCKSFTSIIKLIELNQNKLVKNNANS